MNPDKVFPIFMGTWIVLGIISFIIFFFGKDAVLKRKLWTPFVILASVLFIGFAMLMGFHGQEMFFMIPFVILITYLNIKCTKFCDSCGKTIINQNFFVKPEFCTKCGSKLH